jgi:hypothetical protein
LRDVSIDFIDHVEFWTRVTRIFLHHGNAFAAQSSAEKCLNIIFRGLNSDSNVVSSRSTARSENGMPSSRFKNLKFGPKIWRWVSLCERYFGVAISRLIQPTGQDKALQLELRLAALRHLALACQYGQTAQVPTLTIEAALDAWNVSLEIMRNSESTEPPSSLPLLQSRILNLIVEASKMTIGDIAVQEQCAKLCQQFYIALIEHHCADAHWNEALALVEAAFVNTPQALQKPLWKQRVVVLSKMGRSALDGIQKLKESDPSLQARVFAILARNSTLPEQQLEGYQKILGGASAAKLSSTDKVEYLLEISQWMSSSGFFSTEIKEMLYSAMDLIYQKEESLISFVGETYDLKPQSLTKDSDSSNVKSARMMFRASGRKLSGLGSSARGSFKLNRSASIFGQALNQKESHDEQSFDCRQLEQAARTSVMIGLLEADNAIKVRKLLESVYFMMQFHRVWSMSVIDEARRVAYAKLVNTQQDVCHFDSFKLASTEEKDYHLPVFPLTLLKWQPAAAFFEHHKNCVNQKAYSTYVPSPDSVCFFPLTVHYTLIAATMLENYGFATHALFCLAWLRSIIIVDSPSMVSSSIIGLLYFKVLFALDARISLILSLIQILVLVSKLGIPHSIIFDKSFGFDSITCSSIASNVISDMSDLSKINYKGGDYDGFAKTNDMFGFYTYTKDLNIGTDVTSAVSICQCLYDLSQYHLCHRLALSLRIRVTLNDDKRNLLGTTIILAQLEYDNGKFKESFALLLSVKNLLHEVGDTILLSRVAVLMIDCNMRMGETDEALRIASDVIQLFTQYATITGDIMVTAAKDGLKMNTDDSQSVRSGSSSSLKRNSFNGQSVKPTESSLKSRNDTEKSFDLAQALLCMVLRILDLLLTLGLSIDEMDENFLVKTESVFEKMDNYMANAREVLINIVNNNSKELTALLEKFSDVSYQLVRYRMLAGSPAILRPKSSIVRTASLKPNLSEMWNEEAYVTSFNMAIDQMEQALVIRRGFVALSTAFQAKINSFASSLSVEPAPAAATALTPAKSNQQAAKKAGQSHASEAESSTQMKLKEISSFLSLEQSREVAILEMKLSHQMINMAIMNKEHLSKQKKEVRVVIRNVADKYIYDNRQPDDFKVDDFKPTMLEKVINTLGPVRQTLGRTVRH